jgi:hypothetical protein
MDAEELLTQLWENELDQFFVASHLNQLHIENKKFAFYDTFDLANFRGDTVSRNPCAILFIGNPRRVYHNGVSFTVLRW